jgi:DivIVA domain-containing protein
MMWVFAILIVLAMGSIAVVAAGRGTPLQEEYDDRPDVLVPVDDEPIGAGDLKAVRFSMAVRGYRMSEVDALLSRLAKQLEDAAGEPVPLALPAPDQKPGTPAEPPAGQAAPRVPKSPGDGGDPA